MKSPRERVALTTPSTITLQVPDPHRVRDLQYAKRDLEHAKRDLEYAKRDL
jgi:hypothetical protein